MLMIVYCNGVKSGVHVATYEYIVKCQQYIEYTFLELVNLCICRM